MTRTTSAALTALALTGSLLLTACGGGGDTTTTTGSSSSHGGGHSTDGATAGQGNDADVAFLAGMTPHHAQAVEMSEIVLAADPPAQVAAIAQRIKAAQAPEIAQMNGMLSELGESTDPAGHSGHGSGHGGSGHGGSGHGGMMTDAELAQLEAADGTDAARLYLQLMIRHHEGAIEASDAEIADGRYAPAIELATTIKQQQSAEITEMRDLLGTL